MPHGDLAMKTSVARKTFKKFSSPQLQSKRVARRRLNSSAVTVSSVAKLLCLCPNSRIDKRNLFVIMSATSLPHALGRTALKPPTHRDITTGSQRLQSPELVLRVAPQGASGRIRRSYKSAKREHFCSVWLSNGALFQTSTDGRIKRDVCEKKKDNTLCGHARTPDLLKTPTHEGLFQYMCFFGGVIEHHCLFISSLTMFCICIALPEPTSQD